MPENIYSQIFPQKIWRIMPHPTRDVWAVELRDTGQKQTSWAVLDMQVPELRWQAAPEGTDWWSTLTAFTGDSLYLHNYLFPDVPEPTDLLAVSAINGQVRWVLPGWLLVQEAPEPDILIVARNFPETIQYQRCDARTGILLGPLDQVRLPSAPASSYRSPVRYQPRDIYFGILSSFLEKMVGVSSLIAVDYLEADPYLVFSYYLYEQEKVAQYLLIVNRAKEILHQERLSESHQGIGRDTILWKSNRLVCLRNSNEFISIKLPPLE